ncbi:MAG: hypothetical protein JSV91_05520 [Phycisphaerales bacterium]|nr:MAG: hypothetical protein JSV91_05520 [Phycisphaerales bacterium]
MTWSRRIVRIRPLHVLAASLCVLVLACSVLAYPKPAQVPYRWELTFEPGDLRLYVDTETGLSYWYFAYKVTNRTGKDQIWAPTCTLFTDVGEIMKSGRGVPSRVTGDLLELLSNEFLQSQNAIIGEIRQGAEHAKEGLVVWPARNLTVNELSLFVGGISGETVRVANPLTGEQVILRKTLHRDYLIRGDALARGSKPVELVDENWILR